jgi:hypothetical protein
VVGFGVPEALRSAFPQGLRAGAAYSVSGSLTLALVLLAEACRRGPGAASSGCPGSGMEVAAHQGLDLDRVLLVPAPGDQWSTVVAALAEIVPVVLAAAGPAASRRGRATGGAAARARLHAAAEAGDLAGRPGDLHASPAGWRGLGEGHGCLLSRRIAVEVRHRAGRTSRHHLEVS